MHYIKIYDLIKNGRCDIVIERYATYTKENYKQYLQMLWAILQWLLGCCRKKSLQKTYDLLLFIKIRKNNRKGIRIRWSLASLSLCAISFPNIVVDLLGLQLGILTSFIKV